MFMNMIYGTCTDSLFTSMPIVQHALEIGQQAELYSYEQNVSAALDCYTSAMNVLVPFLPQEPSGKRKDLLQKQVSNSNNLNLFGFFIDLGIRYVAGSALDARS